MGDSEIARSSVEELQKKMKNFQITIDSMLASFKNSVNFYFHSMQTELNKVDSYVTNSSLEEMHKNAKKEYKKGLKLIMLHTNSKENHIFQIFDLKLWINFH